LLPRARPAAKLDAVLAKDPAAGPNVQAPGVPDFSWAPKSTTISAAQAREAHRCAVDGVRLIHEGRPAQAIPLLERAVKLNPRVAGSHHDLGVALL